VMPMPAAADIINERREKPVLHVSFDMNSNPY